MAGGHSCAAAAESKRVAGMLELERRLRESGAFAQVQHDPTVLYRFLIAGRGDPARAAALVDAMLAWRAAGRVDEVAAEFEFTERDAFLRGYPQGYHKTDRAGRPVYIQQLGRADVDAVLALTSEERMVNFHVQEFEKLLAVVLPACNAAAGGCPRADGGAVPKVKGSTGIIDMRGVGFATVLKCKRLLTLFLALDTAYYPETMDCMLIVGAPSWFAGALAAYRAMLSPEFQARIEIIPGDFRPRLRELVGEENLLPEYGGTSAGELLDDIGPWRDPELLAKAGLVPGAEPAGWPHPPASQAHAQMAAALALAPAGGSGGASSSGGGAGGGGALQPSVMVAAEEDTETGELGAWHSLPDAPCAAGATKRGLKRAAAARPPPAAHAKPPVRPSPFANPQQHLATLSAIHGGRAALLPANAAAAAAAAAAAQVAAAEAAAAADHQHRRRHHQHHHHQHHHHQHKHHQHKHHHHHHHQPAEHQSDETQQQQQQERQAAAAAAADVRPPYLARLRIRRAPAPAAPARRSSGSGGGGRAPAGGQPAQDPPTPGGTPASFVSCASWASSGGGQQLSGGWSGHVPSSDGSSAAARTPPRRGAAAAWREGGGGGSVSPLAASAAEAGAHRRLSGASGSCYLTPHGSLAPPAPVPLRLSTGRLSSDSSGRQSAPRVEVRLPALRVRGGSVGAKPASPAAGAFCGLFGTARLMGVKQRFSASASLSPARAAAPPRLLCSPASIKLALARVRAGAQPPRRSRSFVIAALRGGAATAAGAPAGGSDSGGSSISGASSRASSRVRAAAAVKRWLQRLSPRGSGCGAGVGMRSATSAPSAIAFGRARVFA